MSRAVRTAGDDLASALIVFAVFAWELVVFLLLDPLLGSGPRAGLQHQLITAAGWGMGGVLLARTAVRSSVIADRSARDPAISSPTVRVGIVVAAAVLAIAVRAFAFGEVKIAGELAGNGADPLATVVLLLYYLTEAFLIVLLILFAQRAGVAWFGHPALPWGGVLLALTWGVMHLFLQGLSGGLYAIIASVLYGLIVVHGPRRIPAVFAIVALAFIV
ncbi:hypothetical protein MT349_19180 [Rathayibacter caricis]|uniref:hypothetical protein n=1 Tax=Rathayibacter caricis TaxID=110936 RepID=UPI001FB2631E|nr:hypothetical protein [Rathayibacter caricis]MCJ1697911.1 hypothetical protein [Rathayibacter caricis]